MYFEEGGAFVSSELTRGPWDEKTQHGGPPSALLATLMEGHEPRDAMMTARITVELLRPIPIARLQVQVETLKTGKNTMLLAASLRCGGDELARASALRIRTADVGASVKTDVSHPPGPSHGKAVSFFPTGFEVGYHTAVDFRFVRGSFNEPGPGVAWTRLRVPLISGKPTSPLARVMVASDSASGVGGPLDYQKWLYVNPDLTVYFHRMPRGEWVCLDARAVVEPHGIGLAESTIFDEDGAVARGTQSLLVKSRPDRR
jgi:hypothetical protein